MAWHANLSEKSVEWTGGQKVKKWKASRTSRKHLKKKSWSYINILRKEGFKSIGLVVKEWHRLQEVLGSRPTLKKVIFLNFFQLFTPGFRVRLRRLHFFWTSHNMILYRPYESKLQTLSKNASWLRCCNTTVSTWFETQTQNDERPVRGQTLQEGEVHENKREGGPHENRRGSENRRDLVCLKARWSENRGMEGVHTQSTEVVGS